MAKKYKVDGVVYSYEEFVDHVVKLHIKNGAIFMNKEEKAAIKAMPEESRNDAFFNKTFNEVSKKPRAAYGSITAFLKDQNHRDRLQTEIKREMWEEKLSKLKDELFLTLAHSGRIDSDLFKEVHEANTVESLESLKLEIGDFQFHGEASLFMELVK